MSRTLNEELFERVMRLPHAMRLRMQGNFGPQPMPHRPGDHGRLETMPHRPGEGGRFETLPHRPGGRGRFDHPGEGPRFEGMPGEPDGFETLPHRPGEGGPQGGCRAPFARERALELLMESEAGLRQKEIGEGLGINPSSTSEFVSRLEADGYVRREADPTDGRATRIVLSEMGRARAAELRDIRETRFDALFGSLTDDEKRQLVALLDKLLGREEKGNQMVRV